MVALLGRRGRARGAHRGLELGHIGRHGLWVEPDLGAVGDEDAAGRGSGRLEDAPQRRQRLPQPGASRLGVLVRPELLRQRLTRVRPPRGEREKGEERGGLSGLEARHARLAPARLKPAQQLDPPLQADVISQ
jgi:hypothetical protein